MKLKFYLLNRIEELNTEYNKTKDDSVLEAIEELKLVIQDL